ncbi:MAG: hypothetical protein KGZ58_01725 [Ignavibacteriales bacterium]|nr:hypothetical protein [Ignavibacteriales bacterium]
MNKEKIVVEVESDTKFRAWARKHQNDWRCENDYKAGTYKNRKGELIKLGSILSKEDAFKKGANFLSPKIRETVKNALEKKQKGALISEPRIWNNLLSSQPLCFNLFGELSLATKTNLPSKFFRELFPERVEQVSEIKFEYSPGRGDTKYLGDHSAFDVFVNYTNGNKSGFIGIEVKYAESLREENKAKAKKYYKDDYKELTENNPQIFKSGSSDVLREPPLSQIWRDHLLSIATKQDYDEGFFVFLFPSQNFQCQDGVNDYQKNLINDNIDKSKTGFYPRYLEDFIDALFYVYPNVDNKHWTRELKKRYLGE